MLIVISLLIGLVIGTIYGFYMRDLWDKVKYLKQELKAKVKRDVSPQSKILEPPLSPAERAAREQEELIESLNQPS